MAALGPCFDCHALVIACYKSVQEAPGFLGNALFAFVDGAPALDGLTAVPPEAYLSDDSLKQFGHVVLQRRRCLNELTVKHHCTRSALWVKQTHSIRSHSFLPIVGRYVRPLTITFHSNFSGSDQVALVAHEDDGNVFGLAGASQGDAELRGRVKAGAVSDGINNDISTPNLQTGILRGAVLSLQIGRQTRTQRRTDGSI